MKNKGVATWESMPYSDLNGCSLLPIDNQDANAASYKIISYSKIINSDQIAIKTMIYNHHPLMINIIMDNSFINATPGFIWRNNSGSGSMPHALIICGYDDSKHAYKVMNSFGTNWGDAGYSWIDYDYFPLVSSYYLYVMNY
jgi:C1A family cysteine protease